MANTHRWRTVNEFTPYCLQYKSHDISSKNLILDQLIIPQLIVILILISCLLDIVRRNSVLVWLNSDLNNALSYDEIESKAAVMFDYMDLISDTGNCVMDRIKCRVTNFLNVLKSIENIQLWWSKPIFNWINPQLYMSNEPQPLKQVSSSN